MRTDALRQTRGLGEFPSQDYVLLAELALLGEFREIPELLFLKQHHASMSRQANPTLEALADWIKPGGGNRVILEYWNLFFEHLASIHGAPLGLLERALCYLAFVPMWARLWRRRLVMELAGLPKELRRVRVARNLSARARGSS